MRAVSHDTDLARLDATGQAELVRTGQASPTELVDAAIARIEAINPQLNAVIHERFEQARAEAAGELPDGPFRGVPFLLKDLEAHQAGEPHHGGLKVLAREGWTAPADDHLTRRVREAGLVVLGRTNTPELGTTISTEPEAHGPTRNPWNTEHSAGGSSGGSAAAVASLMVPAAHASDGGGSIRIPASENGLVGLKPTRARVSLGPRAGDSWAGATVHGTVTRTVRDSAALLDALAGAEVGDPYPAPPLPGPLADEVGRDPGRLRIGVLERPLLPGVEGDTDVADAVADRRRAPPAARAPRHRRPPRGDGGGPLHRHVHHRRGGQRGGRPRRLGRPARAGAHRRRRRGAQLDVRGHRPGHHRARSTSRPCSGSRPGPAAWRAGGPVTATTPGFDLLVCPVLNGPPPPLGWLTDPIEGLGRVTAIMQFTAQFNVTGQPAISLPLSWNDAGLPIGVQLVAPFGA